MNKSELTNELFTALAKAQSEIKGAVKDSSNPFFKSAYADLESVWSACRDALSKNGLCVVQTTDFIDGQLVINTVLGHQSGQFISGMLPVNPVKNDPQGIGSSISYMRRYALAAIVGVYQTDDDGEAAMDRGKNGGTNAKTNGKEKRHTPSPVPQVPENKQGPDHCGKPMMVSKFDKDKWYCIDCKHKEPINVS